MTYVYQHYPLAMYRNGVYRAVANEAEEEAAKAEGWTDYTSDRERGSVTVQVTGDTPIEVVAVEVAAAPFDEKPALIAQAEQRGIKVDARWGVKRLKEALA